MIKKICLITVARSGSNWFCNAVKNIDGIKGYYELFHPLQPYGLSNNDIEYLSKIHRDQFSYVDGMTSKLSDCPKLYSRRYVMELKFDIKLRDYVSVLLRSLNIPPTRHSKYLMGLSKFGSILYI